MTERERIVAILNHQTPDQLPWCADFDYYIHGLAQDGRFPAKYKTANWDEGLQQMHRDYGAGFYLQGYEPFSMERYGVEEKVQTHGPATVRTLDTPVGQLREVQQYSPLSYSSGITEHLVKDIEDLKVLTWIYAHTTFHPDYTLARDRYRTVGENGVVLCYTPKSPLMHLAAICSGIENLTYMIADDDEEFAALLEELEGYFDKACRLVLESPAECIMLPENISSECVAPFYHSYMKGYHRKWTDRIRAAGKHSFVHQDGTVRGLIHELSHESGFDVIEAVTPLPVGDVEIAEVGGMVDSRTIVWGGIPGGFFSETSCTDEEFEAHVKTCIQVMTKSPRFVLGVADQIVPNSSPERIKRVRELVDRYGGY